MASDLLALVSGSMCLSDGTYTGNTRFPLEFSRISTTSDYEKFSYARLQTFLYLAQQLNLLNLAFIFVDS